MTRWMGLLVLAAGMWLGCNSTPAASDKPSEPGVSEQAASDDKAKSEALPARVADQDGLGECPHAKKRALAAKAGCDCGGAGDCAHHASEGDSSCAGDGQCAGCGCKDKEDCGCKDKANCDCKDKANCGCKDKEDCGCKDKANCGCKDKAGTKA